MYTVIVNQAGCYEYRFSVPTKKVAIAEARDTRNDLMREPLRKVNDFNPVWEGEVCSFSAVHPAFGVDIIVSVYKGRHM